MRNFHFAELAHAFFALLLLVEQLALTGNIAAIAFRRHVLGECRDRLARHHAAANGGLDGDFEQLLRDKVFQLAADRA